MPFVKGQSGNPGGRFRELSQVTTEARRLTSAALRTLENMMRNPRTPSPTRAVCAIAILERGWGKPSQGLHLDPDDVSIPSQALEGELPLIIEINPFRGHRALMAARPDANGTNGTNGHTESNGTNGHPKG